jgi:hypothetical protein
VQDFEKFKLGLVLADSKGHLLSSGLSLEFVYIIGNGQCLDIFRKWPLAAKLYVKQDIQVFSLSPPVDVCLGAPAYNCWIF